LLFIANSISGFAQGITTIAIPWYLINIKNEPVLFGWIYFFITVGSLVWGTYAGTLIDKYNRKNLFLIQTLLGGLILSSAALFSFWHGSTPIALAALIFMFTIFVYNIHYPNLYAFAQEITSQLINLPFEIKTWSLSKIFALDAFTYFAALSTIFLIRYQPVVKRYKETGNAWKQLKTGLQYLAKRRAIFVFGVASYAVFVTCLVGGHYLIPSYIAQILKAEVIVYAFYEIFFALGAVLAGFAITKIFNKTNAIMAVIIMTIAVACVYFMINLHPVVWLFYIGFIVVGLCNAGTRIMRITYLFKHIPNQLIGRTTSVFRVGAVFFRLLFIALFTLPLFVENLKLPYYVFIIFLILSTIAIVFSYKRLNEP